MNENKNDLFGIAYVIDEIRKELRDISESIKNGGSDTVHIREEVIKIEGRVTLLENMLARHEAIYEKTRNRASDFTWRTIERIAWALIVAGLAFGKKLMELL